MDNVIDRINLRTMRSAAVVAHYARPDELLPHERASLDLVVAEVRGGSVLDIGVGGGRTVKALLEVSPDYLGIHYSPEMNDICHNYGVMLYYITLAQQRRQLEDTGFLPNAVAFDCRGRRIADDTTLDSMALIARKL